MSDEQAQFTFEGMTEKQLLRLQSALEDIIMDPIDQELPQWLFTLHMAVLEATGQDELLKQIEQQQLDQSLKELVEQGLLAEVSPGNYSLTVMGHAFAEHRIATDPDTQAFFEHLKRVLPPQTDEER